MLRAISLLLLVLSAAFGVAPHAHAQTLALGSVTILGNDPYPCTLARNGSKFYPGMNCFDAKLSCPSVADINLTFGWTGPSSPRGTIVFFSGGTGESPTENDDDIPTYAASYVSTFEIVYLEWTGSPWEDPSSDGSGGNILAAACRPATFLNYINTSGFHQGAMCAQGASAGSAAIAYSMAWYGAASYLTDVQLISGPVLSEIDQGCTHPNASTPTLCASGTTYCSHATASWMDRIIYVPYYNMGVSNWSGLPNCATSNVDPANYPKWAAMSIVDGSTTGATPTFSYPNVAKHGWLCQSYSSCTMPSCPNNSASEGKYFYDAISRTGDTNLTVTGVTMCAGAEGVAQGTDPDTLLPAPRAIQNNMVANCHN